MDRYSVFQAYENIDTDPNGEWVKYSDAQAEVDRLKAHVRAINSSMDHHAASAANQLAIKISENEALQARVRELEEALHDFITLANMSEGIAGWHLNGDVLPWEDVDQLRVAKDLLTPKGTT